MPTPPLNGIVESALFVKDLGKARTFYQEVLGLHMFSDSEAGCGFEVAKGQLLLLVTSEKAHQPSLVFDVVVSIFSSRFNASRKSRDAAR